MDKINLQENTFVEDRNLKYMAFMLIIQTNKHHTAVLKLLKNLFSFYIICLSKFMLIMHCRNESFVSVFYICFVLVPVWFAGSISVMVPLVLVLLVATPSPAFWLCPFGSCFSVLFPVPLCLFHNFYISTFTALNAVGCVPCCTSSLAIETLIVLHLVAVQHNSKYTVC